MVDMSIDVKYGYADEAAYAAGAGTNEYDETPLTSASGMDYPADVMTFPLAEYEKVAEAGYTLNDSLNYVKSVKYSEASFPMYVQTKTWLEYAISESGSFALYMNVPSIGIRTAMGCRVKSYRLEAQGGDFPKQTIDLLYYSTPTQSALASEPAPLETQPLTHKDISVSIDSTDREVTSLSLSIENDLLDEIKLGAYARVKPVTKTRSLKVELEGEDETLATLLGELSAESTTSHTVVITLGSIATVTISDMVITDGNRYEVPGKRDAFKYKITLEGGSISVA